MNPLPYPCEAATDLNSFACDEERKRFLTEASTLRIPPGVAPERIRTLFGNRRDFLFSECDPDGTLRYRQPESSVRLTVLND